MPCKDPVKRKEWQDAYNAKVKTKKLAKKQNAGLLPENTTAEQVTTVPATESAVAKQAVTTQQAPVIEQKIAEPAVVKEKPFVFRLDRYTLPEILFFRDPHARLIKPPVLKAQHLMSTLRQLCHNCLMLVIH